MNSNTTYNYLSQRKPSVTNFIYLPSALDSSARTRIFIQIDCDSPIQIDSYFHTLPTPQVRRPVTLLRPRGHDNRGAPLLCQPRFQASNWRSFNRHRLRFGLLFSQGIFVRACSIDREDYLVENYLKLLPWKSKGRISNSEIRIKYDSGKKRILCYHINLKSETDVQRQKRPLQNCILFSRWQ